MREAGTGAGVLALLVDLEVLAELVSIGTLFVFCMVAAGVLWRRYNDPEHFSVTGIPVRLAGIAVFSLGAPTGLDPLVFFTSSIYP